MVALESECSPLPPEALEERAKLRSCRADDAAFLLASAQVDPVESDLCAVDVEPTYDPHGDLLLARKFKHA